MAAVAAGGEGNRIRHQADFRPGATGDDPTDIEDNWWQQGDPDSSALNVTEKNNHLINRLDQAPRSILENAGLQGEFRDLLERRFSAPAAPESPSHVAAFAGDGYAYVTWAPPVLGGRDGPVVHRHLVAGRPRHGLEGRIPQDRVRQADRAEGRHALHLHGHRQQRAWP